MNSMDKDIDHVLVTEEQMKAKVAEQKKQLAKSAGTSSMQAMCISA